MFEARTVFPGVTHITDCMGVSFTLLEGSDSALLIDAGYGIEDVQAYIRTLTDKPCELILTHGHHDHVLGARWFDRCLMDPADLEEYRLRTGKAQREAVRSQALAKGLSVPEDFLTAAVPEPEAPSLRNEIGPFACCGFDLGGLEAWVIRVPGHTPGSLVVFLPVYRLLLTGDDWNPCTWMWFPSSLPAGAWRRNMLELLSALKDVSGAPVEHVLSSHQPGLQPAAMLRESLRFYSDEILSAAPKVDLQIGLYGNINTHEAGDPEGRWTLVFDRDKWARESAKT